MPMYEIESTHTKAECMNMLDKMAEEQPQILDKAVFGCMAGDHTAWATVEANSEQEARNMLPENVRDKAKVVPVGKFNREQIKQMHQM